jgi:undecaprenyl diphosphate synthase
MPLESNNLPQHVAIIMDGNRRWARARGLPVIMGHKKVVETRVEELIDHAGHLGIPFITFWAFSTENWERPQDEVRGVMGLFRLALEKYAERMIKKGARLNIIGDLSKFDKDIREGMKKFKTMSEKNDKITVTFALNYGGRDEILRAIRKMHEEIRDSRFEILKLDQENFSNFLDTQGMPDPDLIIRTGGEQRLSGFLLWQSEYSEFYFTETLMPDFGAMELDLALENYARRQRRLGK